MNRVILLVSLSLAGAACQPSPSQYTVEYYEKNAAAREEKLRECANDPGALRDDPLCINAKRAGLNDAFGSMRDLPPVGFGKTGKQGQQQGGEKRN